jgi:hypothetical protein
MTWSRSGMARASVSETLRRESLEDLELGMAELSRHSTGKLNRFNFDI